MNAFGRRVGLTVAGRRVLLGLAIYALAAVMLSWSKSRSATASNFQRPAAATQQTTQPTTQVTQGWSASEKN